MGKRRLRIAKFPFNIIALIAILAVIPAAFSSSDYILHILIITFLFSTLTVSLNLMLGYTGQMQLAHAAFFGIGAYAFANLTQKLGVNYWAVLLIAGLVSSAFAFLIGIWAFRLRGIYFAMISYALVALLALVFKNLKSLTGGDIGTFNIPGASFPGKVLNPMDRVAWAYLALGLLALTVYIVDRTTNSRTGRALKAIREDEGLARSTGVNATRYKLISFMIASFFAGIAGGLYASYMSVISPTDFAVLASLMLVAMVVLGGTGTMVGPIIGAFVVQGMPEILRPLAQYYYLIFGVVVVVVILYAPRGIVGWVKSGWGLLARRREKKVSRRRSDGGAIDTSSS